MDLNAIKSRLNTLNSQSNSQNKEKKDYTLIYWKPKQEGKYQIRFVPSQHKVTNDPFHEVMMHYGVGKFPIMALTNWGEDDPIVDFTAKLRKTSEPENWRLAKKLSPKLRVFAPVIVRGEEEKGVRLFEFSKTLYMELLSIADDEDYGDFSDVAAGHDFVVNATKVQDRLGFNLSLRPKPKTSPISEDAEIVKEWLANQPSLLEERFKYTYDKMKEELQKFIEGENEEESEDSVSSETPVGFENDDKEDKPKTNFNLDTQGNKPSSKATEFDKMFEGEGDDDLPF
jgi:hypothetical protein|tara:strand:- start:326 stop:1180 length:855 start_codon:yes stop_codon:yes gene_type:complete